MTDRSGPSLALDRSRIREIKRSGQAVEHGPSAPSRARFRIEYMALRLFEGIARALGPDRASSLGGAIWRTLAPWTKRHVRALEHLALAFPEKSAAERERIARSMWVNLGRVFAESMLIDRVVADPGRIRFASPAVIEVIRSAGGQAVAASLHSGNWEVVAWPLTAMGFLTAGVYQRLQNPLIDRRVTALRSRVFPGGIYPKGHGTPRRLLSAVRQGRPVCILADQRELRGIAAPFFGAPAPSNPLPAFIARSLGVPLVAGRSVREGGVRFRIEAELVPVPQTGDRAADIAAATASLQAVFERWIREDPSQWMWSHRRWGRDDLPAGAQLPSTERI